MDPRLVGSWRLEGISTLYGRPDPDASHEVWQANRAAPQHRIAFRGVGYVFRADETGQIESRRDPPLGPPDPFTWRVEAENGRLYLVLSGPDREIGRLRIWVRPDGQKMLWSTTPTATDLRTAGLLVRDDSAPVGRRASPRRTRGRT